MVKNAGYNPIVVAGVAESPRSAGQVRSAFARLFCHMAERQVDQFVDGYYVFAIMSSDEFKKGKK